jgi:DNA modification methylase
MYLFKFPDPPTPPPDIKLYNECVNMMLSRPEAKGADLYVADPPWSYSNNPGGTYNPLDIVDTGYTTLGLDEICDTLNKAYDVARAGARLVVWCTYPKLFEWFEASRDLRWNYKTGGSWLKINSSGAIDRSGLGFHWTGVAELVLLYTKRGGRLYNCWEKPLANGHQSIKARHSEKPVEWLTNMIFQWTPPGGKVVDLYTGTGSLARAATRASRRYVGAEIDFDRHKSALIKLAVDK